MGIDLFRIIVKAFRNSVEYRLNLISCKGEIRRKFMVLEWLKAEGFGQISIFLDAFFDMRAHCEQTSMEM